MNLHISIIVAVFSIVVLSSGLFLYPVYGQLPQLSRQSTSITVQASSSSVVVGSSVTFSGTLTDQSGTGVPNAIISIKEDNCNLNCILVTGVTDSGGSFALTWTSDRTGSISIFSNFVGDLRYQGSSSGDITVQVNSQPSSQPTPSPPVPPSNPQPYPPSYPSPTPALPVISRTVTVLSLQSSANSVSKGDTVTFSGKLSDENGNGIAFTQIHLVLYDVRYDILGSLPVTTGSDGTFSQDWTADISGPIIVTALFDGTSQYTASKSNIVTLYVSLVQQQTPSQPSPIQQPPSQPPPIPQPPSQPPQQLPQTLPTVSRTVTILSLQSSANELFKGDTVTFSGQLTDAAENGIPNEPIRILIYDVRDYYQSHEFKTATDSFGNFNQQWVADVSGTQAVVAIFAGSDNYYASKSNPATLYISLVQSQPSVPFPTLSSPLATARVVTITQGSGADQNCVMAGNCYDPDQVVVHLGQTVVWKNDDSVSHTVTSGLPTQNNTGSLFDSGMITPGSSFSWTFQNAGDYQYFCMVHPWMTGQIMVTQNITQIPSWIKNNAKWWAEDKIGDSEFVKGVQYLIQQGVMSVPQTQAASSGNSTEQIPSWIKKNAEWWASGQISDEDFVKAIQYLIRQGIVKTE